jgi:hypothetical protein
MKKRFLMTAFGTLAMSAFVAVASADVKVTDQATYTRHDGGSDAVITSCGSDATTPGPGGDAGGERQQQEPAVAVKHDEPSFVVASANDSCTLPLAGDIWQGIHVSQDGGITWTDSLLPGYPGDTSADGLASPLATAAGDPLLDWDNDNHLFAGGVSFNRTASNPSGLIVPGNARIYVARYTRSDAAALGMDFDQTVIVGEGNPSPFLIAGFNDKPSLKVDDWIGSPFEGSVYVSWALFEGLGQSQILFSRSTDGALTFSKPIKISKGVGASIGTDIAVAADGTVYVVWRELKIFSPQPPAEDAIVFVKSTDGGKTFSEPRVIRPLVGYDLHDSYVSGEFARACGDGLSLCASNFVFHRWDSLPQATADETGNVYVTWEQMELPFDSGDTFHPDGQSEIVVTRSTNGGASWSDPTAVDEQASGHQYAPNIEYNKATDTLGLIYWDSRFDPFYSVTRPVGNQPNPAGGSGLSPCGAPVGSVPCNVLNTFIATSSDGTAWTPTLVSSVGHQPQYEMFGDAQQPFQGDYNWIDAMGTTFFAVWADNRDVVPGIDPREPVPDGFDVLQCRTMNPDGSFSADNCLNAGGRDQNIYGGAP